ncbi:distal tail protein Dit [Streptomyces sp. GTA36]
MAQQALGRIQWGPLTFGPGSQYAVTALEGIDDLPDIRSEDMARPGQHGDYTGPDYTEARTIQLKLGLRGQSPDDLRALSLALRAATQPQDDPAPLQFLDQDTLVYAKVRKRSIPYDAERLWRIGDAALEFYCADPYLYGLTEKSAWTTAYSPAAGRTYPLTYAGVVPATNLVLNPSAEIDLSNILSFGANVTRTRDTSVARVGSASVRVDHTSNTIAGGAWSISPVSSGIVQAGIWVKLPPTGFNRGNLAWRSGTTSLGVQALTPPTSGDWVRVTGSYTLTAGQTCDNIAISYEPAAAGAQWWVDAVMAEVGDTLHDYGDGSMTGNGWSWTGTPHASTSVRTLSGTNRTYGSAGSSGRLTAVNNGASPAYPVLRLDGPVANPAIEQVTTGGILTLDATLQPGEYLLIDTRTRAVLLMGSTPRRDWVRGGSVWPLLQPGSNELAFRGSALPGAAGQSSLLTVTWRDTSL